MSHGRRFPEVRFHVRHSCINPCPETHPECSLRYVSGPFHHHSVPCEGTPFLVGFAVAFDAVGMEYLCREVVVVLGKQLSKGLTPVEQETFTLFIGTDHLSGKGGKPQGHGITPPPLEFFLHMQGPRPLSGLVAVDVDVAYRSRSKLAAKRLLVQSQVVFPIPSHSSGIQFIHLKARSLRWSGPVRGSYQGICKPVDIPFPFRCRPVKYSIAIG